MHIPTLTDLLPPKKTAEALGVAQNTLSVWRATKRYPLKYLKIGSKVFYRRQDVEEFIESRLVGKEDK